MHSEAQLIELQPVTLQSLNDLTFSFKFIQENMASV